MEKKKLYFLLDPDVTKIGDIFILNKADECEDCSYYNICFGNKKIGLSYKVVNLIKPKGTVFCKLVGKNVYLAEVEEAPVKISINTANPPIDVPIIYTQVSCAEKRCPYIKYCVYNGRFLGRKIVIKRVLSKLDCPIGLNLFLCEAFPHD